MEIRQPIINCDWLQIHCDASVVKERYLGYNTKIQEIRTRTFGKLLDISRDGYHIAQLAYKPHSPKLPKGCSVLKIDNYILYSAARDKIITQLINDFDLCTIGTTRFDIAADFQTICGRLPHVLIQDIIQEKVIKRGHAKQSIIGNEQLTAHGSREWQYLRYGSRSSRTSVYFYNKSKELKEVSDKPYIRAIWAANGFAKKKYDTWRLEFSIKGRQMKIIEKDTGLILPNNYRLWLQDEYLHRIFWALCTHYFCLTENNHTRRTNNKPLTLWASQDITNDLVKYLDPTKHSNRADKIFLRKLINIGDEVADPQIINLATTLAKAYAEKKHLDNWRAEQGLQYNYSQLLF